MCVDVNSKQKPVCLAYLYLSCDFKRGNSKMKKKFSLSEDSHRLYSMPLRLSTLAEVIIYCSIAILHVPEEGVTKLAYN